MRIVIEEYNPSWKRLFEEEKNNLESILKDFNFSIEHIGSTAVLDLEAKPIIDILLGLEDFNDADGVIDHLTTRSIYQYIPEYNIIIPSRRYFRKPGFHLHVTKKQNDFWDRHLFFRDKLRSDRHCRMQYENLKRELASKDWKDGNEYAAAKTDFIKTIDLERRTL